MIRAAFLTETKAVSLAILPFKRACVGCFGTRAHSGGGSCIYVYREMYWNQHGTQNYLGNRGGGRYILVGKQQKYRGNRRWTSGAEASLLLIFKHTTEHTHKHTHMLKQPTEAHARTRAHPWPQEKLAMHGHARLCGFAALLVLAASRPGHCYCVVTSVMYSSY